MSEPDDYRPCKACGVYCDGDVCDERCAAILGLDPVTLTYVLTLSVTRVADNADEARWMQSGEAKREIEREVLRAMRKLDGDCDCEVLEVEET